MGNQDLTNHFDRIRASKYDNKIRRLMPGYEAMHQLANYLLNSLLPVNAHLLIVGAGTGMEVITYGIANQGWTFTAVEPSAAMVALCRDNVSASGLDDRVHILCGYATDLSSEVKFDAATSILISHFIQSKHDKLRFFKSISALISNDAPLISVDLFGDQNSDDFKLLLKCWKRLFSSAGSTAQDLEQSFNYIQKDISFVSEEHYKQLLEESGFSKVSGFYREYLFGGWICRKRPQLPSHMGLDNQSMG